MKKSLICAGLILLFVVQIASNQAIAKQYFVNSFKGNDANIGTERNKPWKSLMPVNTMKFVAGDTINFECGSAWQMGLEINNSGTSYRPIVYKAIGEGAKPIFSNSGKMSKAINITAKWVIIDGFFAKNASLSGIFLAKGADHNIIRNCEIENCGGGVMAHGSYNLITQNYAHDLIMVKNTPGGDDDYGAIAYWVFAPHNEIAYNRAVRCGAPSYDYGADGGFFEVYTNGDSTYVHHNYAEDCLGFLEIGGGLARGIIVTDNVSVNSGGFCFHLGSKFKADVQNFRLENNTVMVPKGTKWKTLIDWSGGTPQKNTLILRGNTILLGGEPTDKISRNGLFTHENNTYFLLNGAQAGFSLDITEHILQSN